MPTQEIQDELVRRLREDSSSLDAYLQTLSLKDQSEAADWLFSMFVTAGQEPEAP